MSLGAGDSAVLMNTSGAVPAVHCQPLRSKRSTPQGWSYRDAKAVTDDDGAGRRARTLISVTIELITATAAVLLALVGLVGIIVPVLPGSILVGVGALVWAFWGGSSWGWVAFAVAALLLVVGAGSSLLLTGRSLQRRQVPKWPVTVGIVVGIVGMFWLPGFGLPIGFALGLLLAEWVRMRDFRQAAVTSWETIKSLGVGILIEFGCAMLATSVLAVSIATAW